MGSRVRLASLICVVLLPISGNAQVYRFTTPPPPVTAASADWQIEGEPVFYAGTFYYPTGPNVFFDGNVMARTGIFRGVPLYEDTTLQPYSVVLVPIGGAMMRPYERRDNSVAADYPGPIGTSGASLSSPTRQPQQVVRQLPEATDAGGTIESVPAPTSNRGIFVEYDGARWYSAGPAVTTDATLLREIGRYHGFPVYADPEARDRILVPAVPGGALTPYRR
jgi:hypothetical protein